MKVEKWQALGNDYVILEAAALPWELTPARVRRLCDPHVGVGADGVLLLSEAQQPGFVARLRIFNPDGSEAERNKVRKNINAAWRTVYEELGRNKEESLDDDEYLDYPR